MEHCMHFNSELFKMSLFLKHNASFQFFQSVSHVSCSTTILHVLEWVSGLSFVHSLDLYNSCAVTLLSVAANTCIS